MLRRFSSVIFAFIAFAAFSAKGIDSLCLTELERPVTELTYHVRLGVPNNRPLNFSVFWNRYDSAVFMRADIEVFPLSEADATGKNVCRYVVYAVENGAERERTSGEGKFSFATEKKTGFSAVLTADASGGALSLGGAYPEIYVPVDFDRERPGAIGVGYGRKTKLLNNLIVSRQRDLVRRSRFASEDELAEYLRFSEDSKEGIWTYLDRDVDVRKASLPADYRLATVADSVGGYDIIILAGGGDLFKPLDIKGHLSPTPFIDHYDLEWLCYDGKHLSADTSADIEQGGAVLKLSFPLLGSIVRFRRSLPR